MRMTMRAKPYASLLLSVCTALAACGDEEKDADNEDPVMQKEPVDITISPDEFPSYRFKDLALPYETSETCLAGANGQWSIRKCLCDKCLPTMQECDVLKGCQEIVDCSLKSGCRDSFSCYLTPLLAPCTAVVDRWGNASVATTVALELMECAASNGCR